MKKHKIRIWLFFLMAFVLAVCAMLGTWYVNWWGLVLPWQVLTISTAILALAALFSFLSYLLYRKLSPDKLAPEQQAELEREKFVRQQLLQNFQRAYRDSRNDSNSYARPWYLWLNQTSESNVQLLLEMGFEPLQESDAQGHSVVSFWVSEFAVIAAIEKFDSQYFDLSVDLLLDCLNKHRSRQGANGVLVAESVSWMLQRQKPLIVAQAKQFRSLITRCNKALRLNLPIYNILSDFSAITDLQRLFSCFDDQRLEEPLGALVKTTDQGYDETWFSQSFEEIQTQLFVQTTSGLKSQLNAQYRESILVGPYQFALLKIELLEYFRLLYSDQHFEESILNFRGYFFTNSSGDQTSVDQLSLLLASELGYEQYSPKTSEPGRSLFSKQLFSGKLIAEAGLVGVNNRRENSYRMLGIVFTSALVLSLAVFVGLIKYNYDYFRDLDATATLQLEQYQDSLKRSSENIDDLTVPIHRLSELRDIKQIYTGLRPWYIVNWLPNPSIQRAVDLSYQQGLQQILLPALRDYLLKDMFVYNKLEDKLKTIELYNLYKRLYDPQRSDIDVLEIYYSNSLKEEGEGDLATLEKLRILLADGLQQGAVPPKDQEPLIEIVRASLSTQDLSEVLYQYMLQRPGYSHRVDLRNSLGHKASLVFNYPQGYSGYLMPSIFTREGFSQLMLGDDFQLAMKEIKRFEEVKGEIISQSQLSRINRELKRRYLDDYMGKWQEFSKNISLSIPDGPTQMRNSLALMGDDRASPLKKLQLLISHHTDLLDLIEVSKQPSSEPVAAPLDNDLAEQKLLREKQASALQMAQTIARPFAAQHKLVKEDDQGVRPIDVALEQIRAGLDWIDAAIVSEPRGSGLLKQLSAGTGVNPLVHMQDLAGSFTDKLLSAYLTESARQLNAIAMSEVRSLINLQWRQQVANFYHSNLANRYPFSPQALQDVSRESFEDFFGIGGRVDNFRNNFLGYLPENSLGQRDILSFIKSEAIPLNGELSRFLTKAKDIQQRLYTGDELKIDFSIRAQDMSSGLVEIALQGERKIYNYRNGPSLWTEMSWPTLAGSSQDIELQLKTVDKHLLRVSFVGFWNWFKLADTLRATPLEQSSNSLLSVENEGEKVKLILRVNGKKTPFVAGYFSTLRLPSAL